MLLNVRTYIEQWYMGLERHTALSFNGESLGLGGEVIARVVLRIQNRPIKIAEAYTALGN
jgi:hypothetical protein